MRHNNVTIAFAFLLLGNVGCSSQFDLVSSLGGDAVSSIPASIIVVAPSTALTVGQTTRIEATVKDAAGQIIPGAIVAWSSSPPSVASVSNDGTVTPLAAGDAVITAASGNVKVQRTFSVVAAAGTVPPGAPVPVIPSVTQLPESSVETAMPEAPAAGGSIISVAANDDLQAAIDRANLGDVIELARGATFTGTFVLPNKTTGNGWIVIRPAPGAALPPEGTRMTPALAASLQLPRLVTSSGDYAIKTMLSAHHYRLVGLEITIAPTVSQGYGLVGFGSDGNQGQTTLASVAHHLVLDRSYVHGTLTGALRRCVALNSATSAVIDSYISECHENGTDAQAILGWNGPGPYLIQNNRLEGSHQAIMFGGSDNVGPLFDPKDITIRRNHMIHPLAWKGVWTVKTLFELKNARRVLIEGNVLENNWTSAWDGIGVAIKSQNQDGGAPWSGTTDVTFRLNIVRNVGSGINVASNPQNAFDKVVPLARVSINHNLVYNINTPVFNGSRRAFLVWGRIADLAITHNTVVDQTAAFNSLYFGEAGDVLPRFQFTDNLMATPDNYGVTGEGASTALDVASKYLPDGSLRGNVFAGILNQTQTVDGKFPSGNFFPLAATGVGFVDLAGGDYRLAPTSPVKGKATDGRDPGADISAVLTATAGVVLP